MAEGFVKIRSYWSPEEAKLAKMYLESHGIDAELEGETMVGTAWIDANAIGGVKLLVKSVEADLAQTILKSSLEIGGSDESTESRGLSEAGAHQAMRQTEPFDEDESEAESSTPRILSRLRPLMKMYIWIVLGITVLPFLGLLMLLLSNLLKPAYWAVVIPAAMIWAYLVFSKPRKTNTDLPVQ